MASKISINLDTSKENFLVAKCKQNDDLTLEAYIYGNGAELDLTNKDIIIQALKADNTYIIQNTDIVKENNKILAELDRDFTRIQGTTKIEIVLIESGKQNTTFSFYLEVSASVISGAVESSNTVTILENLQNKIVEAGAVKEETEQLIQNGGAATTGQIAEINAQLEQKKYDIKTKELNCYADGLTDDSTILNSCLESTEDIRLFMNQGQYMVNKPIIVTKGNTIIEGNGFSRAWVQARARKSALLANHAGDILKISVPSSENGTLIKNISLLGQNLAQNGLVVGDYEFSGTVVENVHVMDVTDTGFILEGNNYATYYEKLFTNNVKVALSLRKGNSHNVTFSGCHFYSHGTVAEIFTDFDVSTPTSKMIVFDNCDFTHTTIKDVNQYLVKTGKCNNVVFNKCYFEGAQNTAKDYLIELGTTSGASSNIKFIDCHFSAITYDYFAKLTNCIFPVFENCYFESFPSKAWFKASTDTTDTVVQSIQGTIINQSFSRSIPLIGTDTGKTALPEENAFFIINNKGSAGNAHQQGGFKVNSNKVENYIYRGYDDDRVSYPYPFYQVQKNAIYFGNGLSTPNKGFIYDSNGNINFNNGLKTGINYLTALQIGNVWLWCNVSNHIMFKRGSAPTSDSDGKQLTT